MPIPYFETVTYYGTTAAQSVAVGFRPRGLMCFGNSIQWLWSEDDLVNVYPISAAVSAATSAAISLHDHGVSLPGSNTTVNNNGSFYVMWCWR